MPMLRAAQSTCESVIRTAQYTCVWPHKLVIFLSLYNYTYCVCLLCIALFCFFFVISMEGSYENSPGLVLYELHVYSTISYRWKQDCLEMQATFYSFFRVYCALMNVDDELWLRSFLSFDAGLHVGVMLGPQLPLCSFGIITVPLKPPAYRRVWREILDWIIHIWSVIAVMA